MRKSPFLVSGLLLFIICALPYFTIARGQRHQATPTHNRCPYYTHSFLMTNCAIPDRLQMNANHQFHHLQASACSQRRSYVRLSGVAQCHRGSVSDSVYQLQHAFLRHPLFSLCAPSLIASPLSRPAPYKASVRSLSALHSHR